jgi:hypothetical protein
MTERGGLSWRRSSLGILALAIACAAALPACSSAGGGPTGATSAAPRSAAGTDNSAGPVGSAIVGTWQTGSVSVDQMVSALRAAGLQKWVQPFRARGGMGGSNVFRLTVADGYWHEEYSKDGAPFVDFDDATYQLRGGTVLLSQGAGSYRWSVRGATLSLSFVPGSMSGSDPQSGIPGEVLQRAFYTAVPFHRQG